MDGLNNLGEGAAQGFIDSLTKLFPAAATGTAQIISAYRGTSPTGLTPEQQMAYQQQLLAQQQQEQMSKYLLYGGLAIGAIALLIYMKKRKSA